eukprot:284816088_2
MFLALSMKATGPRKVPKGRGRPTSWRRARSSNEAISPRISGARWRCSMAMPLSCVSNSSSSPASRRGARQGSKSGPRCPALSTSKGVRVRSTSSKLLRRAAGAGSTWPGRLRKASTPSTSSRLRVRTPGAGGLLGVAATIKSISPSCSCMRRRRRGKGSTHCKLQAASFIQACRISKSRPLGSRPARVSRGGQLARVMRKGWGQSEPQTPELVSTRHNSRSLRRAAQRRKWRGVKRRFTGRTSGK